MSPPFSSSTTSMQRPNVGKVRVAVVGSGLAGLTAAYLLNTHPNGRYEVHLYEQADQLGMDSASVVLPVRVSSSAPSGVETQEIHVDVPMRSFQGGYYVRLMALYRSIGLKPEARDFSYSFSYFSPSALLPTCSKGPKSERERMRTKILHNGANGTRGLALPSELALPKLRSYNPDELLEWARTAACNLYTFLATCLWLLTLNIYVLLLSFPAFRPGPSTTLREWSDYWRPKSLLVGWTGAGRKWDEFMEEILVPLFSAVCTCSTEDVWCYPAEEILDYTYLTIGTHHYVVPGGSAAVIQRLTASLPQSQIHLGCGIQSLSRSRHTGLTTLSTPSGAEGGFHHVILATQAHLAAKLLDGLLISDGPDPALQTLRDCALKVPQAHAEVVTHSWPGLLPTSRADERELNLVSFSLPSTPRSFLSSEEKTTLALAGHQAIMATHILPLPPSVHPSQAQLYQTTNPLPIKGLEIPEETVLGRTVFARAYVDVEGKKALESGVVRVVRGWRGKEVSGVGLAQGGGTASSSSASSAEGASGCEGRHGRSKGIWLVGSWVGGGIPLLEGCVKSAEMVVSAIQAEESRADSAPQLAQQEQGRGMRTSVLKRWRNLEEKGSICARLAQDLLMLGWYE